MAKSLQDTHRERFTRSSDVVFEGKIWNVLSDRFSLTEDGDTITREYIKHTGAVSIVALNDDGQVLLINQYRHAVKMNLWEIPAGLLDVEGEDLPAAAARELAEEADLIAERWNVLVDFHNSPGSSSEVQRVYLARGLRPVPDADRHQRTDEEAEIEVGWFDVADAVTAILAGRLHSPSAVVGVLAAASAQATGFEHLRPADAPFPEDPRRPDDARRDRS
ncbi:ADP-ribose pyrophosphatase [Tersicoccus phoenicis]|uniref:ADP-ribose pyrophosphatase n=1 Tax=Tersicoccus phoenicis TaxID=554083 RepID=A0A1R1L7E3_9MICC|nr:NUDIX hydrolase [Tersicoccus phoenicis]OMH23444.1 ADP-ribose pyrophosphatase [Tersicoccus phoenicis]